MNNNGPKHISQIIDELKDAELAFLKAQNAALIAAGDEMADTLNSTYTQEEREANLRDWNKAKGGRK